MTHVLYGRYPSKEMKSILPEPRDFRTDCSLEMSKIFSEETKHRGWRDNWVVLAKSERGLGDTIPQECIDAMEKCKYDISIPRIKEIERKTKHDVVAGATEFGEVADRIYPGTSRYIHRGATSCYITDNQELKAMDEGLKLIRKKAYELDLRGSKGLQADMSYCLKIIDHRINNFCARGAKGATGTSASYLQIFNGDVKKVEELDRLVTEGMGFKQSFTLCSQTYPRIYDYQILSTLALLASAFKHSGLADWLAVPIAETKANAQNAAHIASNQWLERTLDDSASRRIIIEDSFKAADFILDFVNEHGSYSRPSKNFHELFGENLSRAMQLLQNKTAGLILKMHGFASQYKDKPCIAYTHYQPAQVSTVGKRIDLWAYNYLLALEETELFSSMQEPMTPGVLEYRVNSLLAGLAAAAGKQSVDMRLCQHDETMSEPFATGQKGSSAMPHKRNPMKNERETSLASVVIHRLNLPMNPYNFLAMDSVLELGHAIFVRDTQKQKGFSVYPETIEKHFREYLPFLVSESLRLGAVKSLEGTDEEPYAVVQRCAIEARDNVQIHGGKNDMLERLSKYPEFCINADEISELLRPSKHYGIAPRQVEAFEEKHILSLRGRYGDLGIESQVDV